MFSIKHFFLGIVLSAGFLLPAAEGAVTRPANCKLSYKLTWVHSISQLPLAIQNDLKLRGIILAGKDENFNSSDLLEQVPSRRFLKAGNLLNQWIIWYEHGGFGYHKHVVGYRLRSRPNLEPSSTRNAQFIANYVGNQCAATNAILSGVLPVVAGDM
jgi:hypothetical protein